MEVISTKTRPQVFKQIIRLQLHVVLMPHHMYSLYSIHKHTWTRINSIHHKFRSFDQKIKQKKQENVFNVYIRRTRKSSLHTQSKWISELSMDFVNWCAYSNAGSTHSKHNLMFWAKQLCYSHYKMFSVVFFNCRSRQVLDCQQYRPIQVSIYAEFMHSVQIICKRC